MQRFDEMELQAVPLPEELLPTPAAHEIDDSAAPRIRRLFSLLTDLSLFVALTLALSPLLPSGRDPLAILGLAGFVVMTSFYYFTGSWLLWGRTIGGTIFDVRVVSADDDAMSVRAAAMRWTAMMLSLLSGGLGFLLAALPSARSLPDRLSRTRCVVA